MEQQDQYDQYDQFARDMEAAGYDVQDYHGRYFYEGPSVRLDDAADLQEVIRATTVRVQWDQLGKHGLVVYPK